MFHSRAIRLPAQIQRFRPRRNSPSNQPIPIRPLGIRPVGARIGKGLAFLLDPELTLEPSTSYQLMSHCLRTGEGFANHHKLGDYICGGKADFLSARQMVNGTDAKEEIANSAVIFLSILLNGRI